MWLAFVLNSHRYFIFVHHHAKYHYIILAKQLNFNKCYSKYFLEESFNKYKYSKDLITNTFVNSKIQIKFSRNSNFTRNEAILITFCTKRKYFSYTCNQFNYLHVNCENYLHPKFVNKILKLIIKLRIQLIH